MHLIRRATFRAASAPCASFISSSRSNSTPSLFVLRSKVQGSISTSVFRRFNSDEASQRKLESADSEQGSVSSAINSASESTSTYAQEASEGFSQAAEQAIDGSAAGAAAGGFAPRRDYKERDLRSRYDNNRGGDRGGYGGDRRGGYGGGRDNGMSRGGDRGGYGGRNDRQAGSYNAPERVLTPNPSVYVGNLLFDITAQDLEKEFSEYGVIKSAIIATDPRGLSKGFGYIEFETTEHASAAIEARHQSVLEGRRLIVNYMAKTTQSKTENPPSKTLFIGNLAFEMSDADLNKLFRDIRNVIDVRVAIDRRTGQPRGFAHADFVDTESAIKGKEALLGKEIYGRALRVDFSAGARENRPEGGFASRGDRGDRGERPSF